MPSTELMNICTDFAIKAVKIKSSFSIHHKKHTPRQEPQNHDLIYRCFYGRHEVPALWWYQCGGKETLQSYLAFGEKRERKQHKICWWKLQPYEEEKKTCRVTTRQTWLKHQEIWHHGFSITQLPAFVKGADKDKKPSSRGNKSRDKNMKNHLFC